MSEDIAWAAGLFEGEGCMSEHKSNSGRGNYKYPLLTLKMTDRDVVEKFMEVVGAGQIVESAWYRKQGHKPQWLWSAGSRADTERILRSFLPYFGSRRTLKAVEMLSLLEHNEGLRTGGQLSLMHIREPA